MTTRPLRVATYNVHGCVGRGGLCAARVADVIAALECDVVALQEIDVRRPRSGGVDQATFLADRLGCSVSFGPACVFGEHGAYGNAVLSRWPILASNVYALPESRGMRCEPRSIVEARVVTPYGNLQAWSTHLGVRSHERDAQAKRLIAHVTTALAAGTAPLVLLGDMNAGMDASMTRALGMLLLDARRRAQASKTATFPSWFPLLALDHVFASSGFLVRDVRVARTPLAAQASDHLPLVVTLGWPDIAEPRTDLEGSPRV